MEKMKRAIEYKVIEPMGDQFGIDLCIETFSTYEQAEEFIQNNQNIRSLRIDKTYVLDELPF